MPPCVAGRHQWFVSLGGLNLTVDAASHQKAKAAAICYWASCNGAPESFAKALHQRAAERWRGGLKARLMMRAATT